MRFRLTLFTGLACLALASGASAATLTYQSENLSATVDATTHSSSVISANGSQTATSGSGTSTTAATLANSSINGTLSQSFSSNDTTSGQVKVTFTVSGSTAYSISGSGTFADPFGLNSFNLTLTDQSKDGLSLYQYSQFNNGDFTVAAASGTLQSGDVYQFEEYGSLGSLADPSLNADVLFTITAANDTPEPSSLALAALALLAGTGLTAFAKRFSSRP